MRIAIVSALALAIAACGQQPAANESADAGAGEVKSGGSITDAFQIGSDGVPQMRPGLWEITEAGGKEVRRECQGAEVDEAFREVMTRDYPKECKIDRDSDSGRIYLKATCQQDGMSIDTEVEMTGSDTAFDGKVSVFVTMPDGKKTGGTETSKGRWIGECPAGVQPGEEVEA